MKSSIFLLLASALLLYSCVTKPVDHNSSERSVDDIIERYERLGAPNGREYHETTLDDSVRNKRLAAKAFKQTVTDHEALSDLLPLGEFDVFLTEKDYFYCVLIGTKHVYLVAAKRNSKTAFWIAMI